MPSAPDLKCPHCGAQVGKHWKSCWLCGLPLQDAPATGPSSDAPPVRSAREPGPLGTIVTIAGGFIALALLLAVVGLISEGEYGGIIALVILLLPAGIFTLLKSRRREKEGEAFTPLEKFGTFLMSLAVTIGTVVALGVAACIAFFIACIAMLSSGSFH